MEVDGVPPQSHECTGARQHSANPLLRYLAEEDCGYGATASASNRPARGPTSETGSCVMRELAIYLEQQRLLPPGSASPLKAGGAGSSGSGEARPSAAGAAEGEDESARTSPGRGPWSFGGRMRVQLQPDVDAGGESADPGADCEDDGGAALESKTAAFEFLFDDNADDDDSRWVEQTLRVGDRKSDAVLSCAGCFTPVCYQCQRHETIQGLFRSVSAFRVKLGPPDAHPEAAAVAAGGRTTSDSEQSVEQRGCAESHQSFKSTSFTTETANSDPTSALLGHIKSRLIEKVTERPRAPQSGCAGRSAEEQIVPSSLPSREVAAERRVRFESKEEVSVEAERVDEDAEAEGTSAARGDGGRVHSLVCTVCATVVGWRDASEVYFFDQVLPSEA